MAAKNFLYILSDEHNKEFLGCYGSRIVRTPNIDALAAAGTVFTNVYCASPICVPSRASIATGRYVHETHNWDNAFPYDGSIPSWAHRLRDAGRHVTSIGKLHFRSNADDNGFSEQLLPIQVVDGLGDVLGLIRTDMPKRKAARNLAEKAGRGESDYTQFDRQVADEACRWFREEAPKHDEPWLLFVSFVAPHFPLVAPPEYFDLYALDRVPMPRFYAPHERPRHPVIDGYRESWNYDDYFDEEKVRTAVAAYCGLCSFLDDRIGQVLRTLEECGLREDTCIMYASDHGDNAGNRGLWGKSVMYEESVAVPLVMAGRDVPSGQRVGTHASLLDLYPTFVQALGEPLSDEEKGFPGHSLIELANGVTPERTVFSEYHAGGSITGQFMVRVGKWKYVHYVGYPPQLFDLEADPHEAVDLGTSEAHAEVRAECEAKLREIVDPEAVNELAFRDQAERIKQLGGREAILARSEFGYTPAPTHP